MHEMAIAQNIIAILQEEMEKHTVTNLRSVRIHIGRMTAVVPESLTFCFTVLTEGTGMEGARLVVDMIPVNAHCRSCDTDFTIDDYVFTCTACGNRDIDIIAGRELSIVEIVAD